MQCASMRRYNDTNYGGLHATFLFQLALKPIIERILRKRSDDAELVQV
jgi:hypothetical protein